MERKSSLSHCLVLTTVVYVYKHRSEINDVNRMVDSSIFEASHACFWVVRQLIESLVMVQICWAAHFSWSSESYSNVAFCFAWYSFVIVFAQLYRIVFATCRFWLFAIEIVSFLLCVFSKQVILRMQPPSRSVDTGCNTSNGQRLSINKLIITVNAVVTSVIKWAVC